MKSVCTLTALILAASLLFSQTVAPAVARADTLQVAVAANFTEAAKEVAVAFEAETGEQVVLSFGSTGQLYAQIEQAAPFDLFLAADEARPRLAIEKGLADAGSQITYAQGRLVLWSADAGLIKGPETLEAGAFQRLAIANPVTAPYGAAAMEILVALNVADRLEPKLVEGASISQTYQFVASGNAELGFIALSQVAASTKGSRWRPPQSLYTPIKQDAVVLSRARNKERAQAFLTFLKGDTARIIIARFGYGLPALE